MRLQCKGAILFMASNTKTTANMKTSWIETPPISPKLKHLSAELIANMPWLDKISSPVQSWISKLYGHPRQVSYRVKDILNGVWLGHPLHPVLVTVPLGAWTSTFLLDLAWLADQDESTARNADLTLWLGLAGAVGAAVTGATNWVDTDGPPQRTGMLHALLNVGITTANLVSAVLRITGNRRSAISIASTGYAISLYSAYIGGEFVLCV